MPGKGRIDSIIDIPAVKSEYDELKKMLADLGISIKNAGNADALKNPSISLKELRKAIGEVLAEQEKLVDNTKKTQKANTELERAQDKLINSYSAEARALAEVREQQNLVNKANKLSAQETLGLVDAYKRLEMEYNKAQREAKNMIVELGHGSKEAQDAAKHAFMLGEKLKAADAAVNQFHRNVGNYTNALNILEKELGDVKKKIDDYTKSGNQNKEVLEELRKEQELLEQLVNNQAAGFEAMNAEIKESEKALIKLKAAGKEDSAMYRELFAQIAQAKDELKDFKEEMATRGDGELYLTATIQAAQTLAAAYGLAQGAAALFGKENEELQKVMVKLQAVLTILTSLETLNNALKKESAIRVAISIGLQKLQVLQTNLQTYAESKNILVKYAAIAAQKLLNTVMLANPILLVVGALALLTLTLSSFTLWTDKAAASFEKLNNSLEDDAKLANAQAQRVKANGQIVIASQEAQFASAKKLSETRIRFLRSEDAVLKKTEDEYWATAKGAEMRLKKHEAGIKKMTDDEKKGAEAIVATMQGFKNDRKNIADAITIEKSNQQKKDVEDTAKASQQEIDILNVALAEKQRIMAVTAADERVSFQKRIEAQKEFSRLQEQIILNDLKKQLTDPNLVNDPVKRRLLERQAQAALVQTKADGIRQVETLEREYQKRRRAALFESMRLTLEGEAAVADKIADNEKKGYEVRLDAAYKAYEKRRQVIIGEMEKELKEEGLIEEERIAIHKKAAEAINQLTRDYTDKQKELYKFANERAWEDHKNLYDRRDNIIRSANAKALSAIEEAYGQRRISQKQYEEQTRKAENAARLQSLGNEVNRQTGLKITSRKGSKEQFEAERDYEEAVLAMKREYARQQQEDRETANQEMIAKLSGWSASATNILAGVGELKSIGYDKELTQLEELTVANEKLKNAEVERITKSTLSEEEKAARIAVINAKAQAQQDEIDRRRRRAEIEKARFDKAANIANIITSTALAVVTMLADRTVPAPIRIPLAISVGALGAAQLARAVATPLPKFAKGTDSSPEGWAIVGEEGAEGRIDPDGKVSMTPNQATVTWLERGTKIIPHDELNNAMYQGMMKSTAMMIAGKADDQTAKKLDAVKEAVFWLGGEMKKAQAKAKAPVIIFNDMSAWHQRIQKNVFD